MKKTLFALVAVSALLTVGTVSAASTPTTDLQAPADEDQIQCIGLGEIICFVYYTACTPLNVCIIE